MSLSVPLPDFNVLVALHQHDPEAFEEFRRHVLRDAVNDAPLLQRPALEKLLCRIETARADAATPMEALLTATRMMQDSVHQLHSAWESARYATAGLHALLLLERFRL